ncbi:cytochrome c biogenesis protein CcsA [Blastococcus sp. CT_GayMR16]|uniref:cytochrome c biogenesis protein CcsA n=1 Tax=Blastococcus sp. CT_GayMR16 TaxID=2559607 RepID=UPI001FD7B1F5|nr:cytochrome c biogenesis protein CcsA [Blastococcus sp. CT_GayMR16]
MVAALRSAWLAVHVTAAMVGFGTFMVSGIANALYLLRLRDLLRLRADGASRPAGGPISGWTSRHSSAAALDAVGHRTAVFGFPIWTFAVIAGAIWAESAWGRFWGWDPKETWAFIAWVMYAAYLHARSTGGLARPTRSLDQRGRPDRHDLQPALRELPSDGPALLRRLVTTRLSGPTAGWVPGEHKCQLSRIVVVSESVHRAPLLDRGPRKDTAEPSR